MKLAEMTWPEVAALSRDVVVVIPTGSLEQHGAHLPLFTDTMLVTSVCESTEDEIADKMLLTPTLWLGASAHHIEFAGSLSNSYEGYSKSLQQTVLSLAKHGFWKFYVVNGHGGNTSLNDIALRELKLEMPKLLLGTVGYFDFVEDLCAELMEGPVKHIQHACEAETSLMMHVAPHLVRTDLRRDDGLTGSVPGIIHPFNERTEAGSLGFATLGTAVKGKQLFDEAVIGLTKAVSTLHQGYELTALTGG